MATKWKKGEYIRARVSRRHFLPLYLMVLALFGIILYFYIIQKEVNQIAVIAAAIFSIILMKKIELERFSTYYEINPDNLREVSGLVGKKVKNVNYHSISDVSVSQTPWQRLLNYGNVRVKMFAEDATSIIKNIPNPEGFVEFMEQKINQKER